MINYPRSLQSDLSFSWRRPPGSGLQVRMCFSSCVNRKPHRGLQTASVTVPERRGCAGWQKRKADVSRGRREKGGGKKGKLAKNNPNSSALKFLWMRFCQGSGNRKRECICFPTDCLFPHRWWQKYTKQYGPVWNYPKATSNKFGTKSRIETKLTCYWFRWSVKTPLFCQDCLFLSVPLKQNPDYSLQLKKKHQTLFGVSWILLCYKTSSGNFLKSKYVLKTS